MNIVLNKKIYDEMRKTLEIDRPIWISRTYVTFQNRINVVGFLKPIAKSYKVNNQLSNIILRRCKSYHKKPILHLDEFNYLNIYTIEHRPINNLVYLKYIFMSSILNKPKSSYLRIRKIDLNDRRAYVITFSRIDDGRVKKLFKSLIIDDKDYVELKPLLDYIKNNCNLHNSFHYTKKYINIY